MFDMWKPLVVACTVVSIAATGCNTDVCQAYESDRAAKFQDCNIPLSPTSTTMPQSNCTDAAAALANCRDACLVKITNCDCFRSPQGPGCAAANEPYLTCTSKCSGSATSSSSSGSTSGSTSSSSSSSSSSTSASSSSSGGG